MMTELSNTNTVLPEPAVCCVMRWAQNHRAPPDTFEKPESLTRKGFINDFWFQKKRHTEILQKEGNGEGEIKATQTAYKQANSVEDPEASLRSLPQLPGAPAR